MLWIFIVIGANKTFDRAAYVLFITHENGLCSYHSFIANKNIPFLEFWFLSDSKKWHDFNQNQEIVIDYLTYILHKEEKSNEMLECQ